MQKSIWTYEITQVRKEKIMLSFERIHKTSRYGNPCLRLGNKGKYHKYDPNDHQSFLRAYNKCLKDREELKKLEAKPQRYVPIRSWFGK